MQVRIILNTEEDIYEPVVGICGATVTPENADKWLCEICENEESEEAAIVRVTHLSRSYISSSHLEPRLSSLSPSSQGREAEDPRAAARLVPPRVQTHRGPRLGAHSLLGLRSGYVLH